MIRRQRFPIFLLYVVFVWVLRASAAQKSKCLPGNFVNGTKCSSCPDNTISTKKNAKSCTPCSPGFLATKTKTECELCPPGFFVSAADGFECIPCELGKYNARTGATDCITCPDNKITFELGARSVLQCGYCPTGLFLLFGEFDVSCQFCPIGKFSDEENATFCKECPKGTFSHLGSSSCKKCPSGTFGIIAAGSGPQCKRCPKGTYQNLTGKKKCIPCPKGSTAVSSRRKCLPICKKGSKRCRFCQRGTGFSDQTGKCEPCSKGTISEGKSATGCWRCPSGLSPNKKRDRCICPKGLGFIDGACRECPFNAKVVKGVKCVCMGDFLLRDGGCLCPSGEKPVGFKCKKCTNAEKKDLIESFRGPCAFCEAGQFWNKKSKKCETCRQPNANPTRNFARRCTVPRSS